MCEGAAVVVSQPLSLRYEMLGSWQRCLQDLRRAPLGYEATRMKAVMQSKHAMCLIANTIWKICKLHESRICRNVETIEQSHWGLSKKWQQAGDDGDDDGDDDDVVPRDHSEVSLKCSGCRSSIVNC